MIDATASDLLRQEVEAEGGDVRVVMEKTIAGTVHEMAQAFDQSKTLVEIGVPTEMAAQAVGSRLMDLAASLLLAGAIIQETYPGAVGDVLTAEAEAFEDELEADFEVEEHRFINVGDEGQGGE